ncbi:MAG: enoyl-CoA hydratase/isomerase family protein [Deltaproteobacteria bacterium]|nr:enoyl-CoA hydratase/isomerase family protein [Deltaproteobacteria bacterium]
MKTLLIQHKQDITTITLNRPECRNALNQEMIAELTQAFGNLSPEMRTVILCGAGDIFCAGADLNWMRQSKDFTHAENLADAKHLADMFAAIVNAKCATIAKVHGAAFGGGAGLAACCDIVVADENCKFGFPEVRIGLIPAVISPYVLRRISVAQVQRYFITGETITATRALQIGLVDEIYSTAVCDDVINKLIKNLLAAGPNALIAAKRLLHDVSKLINNTDANKYYEYTSEAIASLRVQAEAQEGLKAFLEKRQPSWIKNKKQE